MMPLEECNSTIALLKDAEKLARNLKGKRFNGQVFSGRVEDFPAMVVELTEESNKLKKEIAEMRTMVEKRN